METFSAETNKRDALQRRSFAICAALALLWAVCFLLANLPGDLTRQAIFAGLQALFLIVFVTVHAISSDGWRNFLVYFGLATGVSFVLEATSIAYGFPFGFYTHHAAGPKPLGVPLHVPLGYVFLGWLAWSLAKLLVRRDASGGNGAQRFTTPIVAALILMGYDFAYDPIGSTARGMWSYRDPSGYFGVPLSNFLGWLLTGWIFYQSYALIERPARQEGASPGRSFWLLPCAIWGAMFVQYPLLRAGTSGGTSTVGGRTFIIADIYDASIAAGSLTMAMPAIAAAAAIWSMYARPTVKEIDHEPIETTV